MSSARACLVPSLAVAMFSIFVAPVTAAAMRTIAGSPVSIFVADDTSFQVRNANLPAGVGQIFPADCTNGADSGVFAAVAGSLYGPNFAQHGCATATDAIGASIPWAPVSISEVTGSGAIHDPFRVTVVADAGGTGVRLTAVYSYVNGEDLFRLTTTFCVREAASLNVYLGADLYLATSDSGTPYLEPVSMSPGGQTCSGPPYTILLVPITAADSYAATLFSTIWREIGARGALSNTIGTGCIDNGAALHWRRGVAAGECTTTSSILSFGPIPSIELPTDERVACCLPEGCVDLPSAACATRGGQPGARNSACLPRRPTAPDMTHDLFVPLEWQPKHIGWNRDSNGNYVEDEVDVLPPSQAVTLLVALNRAPRSDDLAFLATKGTVGFVSRYLPVVQLQTTAGVAAAIAADARVAHVALDRLYHPDTDVSVAAIRVAPSTTHTPATWDNACAAFGGASVNIAIVDSGVDDPGGPGTTHIGLPPAVFAYDAVTDQFINPDDEDGHGTHLAAIALGRPIQSGGKTYRGVAPKAGLIDIRVYKKGEDGIQGAALERAIKTILAKRVAWNIGVVNTSMGDCKQSDGTDDFSNAVNYLLNAGITVIATMANAGTKCVPPGTALVQSPAAADRVIAVQASSDQSTVQHTDDVLLTNTVRGPRVADKDADVIDEQKPDVTAPGGTGAAGGPSQGITSAQFNTVSGYHPLSGTSMAAPHVAGLAALLIDAKPSLKNSPANVRTLIRGTATDKGASPGWDSAWGMGLVDGYAACQAATSAPVTDLQFVTHCNSGGALAWTSSDLFPGVNPITEGKSNTINAIIRNGGNQNAGPFKVELGYYDLSTSANPYYLVKTVDVPGLAKGNTITISTPWTPSVSLTTGNAHACLVGKIVYPNDAQTANDCARRNVSIVATGSPARFTFAVVNPTDEDLRVRLEHSFGSCPSRGWSITVPAEEMLLRGGDPPRTIHVAIDPGQETRGSRIVSIAAVGTRASGETVSLGGVTLVAQTPNFTDCNRNGADDAVDLALGPSRDVNGNRIPDECEPRRRRAVRSSH